MSEAVGAIEHESASSAPDSAVEIGETISAAEYIRQRLQQRLEQDPALKDKQELEKGERQETVDRLAEHFGDQEFTFQSHTGTITQILDLCPMSEHFVKQGFEAVVAWVEPYKVKDEQEETEGDALDAELEHSKEGSPEPVTDKPVVAIKVEAKEKSQKKTEKVVTSETAAPAAIVDKKTEVILPLETIEVAAASIVEEVAIVSPAVAEEIIAPKIVLEAAADKVSELMVEENITEVVSEPDAKEDVLFEALQQEQALPETEAIEVIEQPTYFEQWKEIAEQNESIDELFVAIVEQLPEAEPEVADAIEISDDEIENMSETISPELQVLFVEVRNVKAIMEKLYTAKTKEECDTYVDELVSSLAELLRSFGYDNPERMIRDFLQSHSFDSLHELIEALEHSLRMSIKNELYQKSTHPLTRKRHVSFGKFVLYVLQTLSGKSTATDLA